MSFSSPFGSAAKTQPFGLGVNSTTASSPFGGSSLGTSAFQSNAAKPAFGGFSPPASSAPAFGTVATASPFAAPAATTMGAFGTSTSQFGTTNNAFAAKPAFGAPTTNTLTGWQGSTPAPNNGFLSTNTSTPQSSFGGGVGFGFGGQNAAAQKPAFGSTSTPFGATATNINTLGSGLSSTFGTNQSAFGAASTSQPTFGVSGTTQPAFGTAATTPAFGANPSPFGFGASSTVPSQNNMFGGQSTSSAMNMGASTPFGGGGNIFGATSAATPFGGAASQPTTSGAFGTSQPFGQLQNNSSPSTFGLSQPSTGGMFGAAPASNTGFGAFGQGGALGAGGTGNPPFKPTQITDTVKGVSSSFNLQVITGMQPYSAKSFEELRLEDYRRGNKTPSSGGGFGSTIGTGAFGQQSSAFGTSTTSTTNIFGGGAAAAPAFGTFAASATPSTQGMQFGSTASPFGATTQTTGGGFGTAPAGSTTFGTAAPTSAFGSAASTPSFGALGSNFSFGKPTTGFGSTSTTTQSAPTGGMAFGGFGTPASAPTTTFGAPSATSFGFGATSTTSSIKPAGGGFGTTPAPSFGTGLSFGSATTPGFGLGSTTSLTAAPATTPSVGSGFSGGSFGFNLSSAPSTMPSFSLSNSGLGGGITQTIPPAGFSNPLAQTPVVSQLAAPPVISIDQKIDFLAKKTNELAKEAKEKTECVAPRSFAGFGSNIASSKSAALPTKLLPRGIKKPMFSSSLSMDKKLANGSKDNDQVLSSISPPSFPIMRSAKSLVVSSMSSPAPFDDLPLPPLHHPALQTPLREGVNRSYDGLNNRIVEDATGLTPIVSSTPTVPIKSVSSQPRQVNDDDLSITADRLDQQQDLDRLDDSQLEAIKDVAPKMERVGYFTSPDIQVLKKMSSADLSRVRSFTIFRPNVGKIEWEGLTDVRNLDLDAIVNIEPREVFVYKDIDPPAQGTGLNKPAIITLYGVLSKPPLTAENKTKFQAKLKAFCASNDATFLSYNDESGEWTFEVQHFSRYGFTDEDDKDGDGTMQTPVEEEKEMISDFRNKRKLSVDASKTNIATNDDPASELEGLKKLKTILLRSAKTVEESLRVNSEARTLDASTSIFSPIDKHAQSFLSSRSFDNVMDISTSKELVPSITMVDMSEPSASMPMQATVPAFLSLEESPIVKGLLDAKQNALKTRGLFVPNRKQLSYSKAYLTDDKSRAGPMGNAYIAMGRSFRVGWSHDGRIVHPGKFFTKSEDPGFAKEQRVVIEKIDCCGWACSCWKSVAPMTNIQLLLTALRCSSKFVNENGASKWLIPRILAEDFLSNQSFHALLKNLKRCKLLSTTDHPDWTLEKAISLVDAVFGQEILCDSHSPDWMASIDNGNDHPEKYQRRREAISNWFESATKHIVSGHDEGSKSEETAAETVMQLLSVHHIDKAAAVAEGAGLFRLALLLSQMGGDPSFVNLMQCQLQQWQLMGTVSTFPTSIGRLYGLLSSCFFVENGSDGDDNAALVVLEGLGWLRGLAMLYWYYLDGQNKSQLSPCDAIDLFDELVRESLIDPPQSLYADQPTRFGANVEYPLVAHGLYNLLKVLFSAKEINVSNNNSSTDQVTKALRSEGYTRDELDVRASYIVLVLLEGLGFVRHDSEVSRTLRLQLIFQLLSEGMVEWAIFVSMQLPEEYERVAVRTDILNRHVMSVISHPLTHGNQSLTFEEAFRSLRQSLADFRVPEQEIMKALATGFGYLHDYYEQMQALAASKSLIEAAQVACRYVWGPKVIEQSHGTSGTSQQQSLLQMLHLAEDGARLDGLSELMRDYLLFKREAQELRSLDALIRGKQCALELLSRLQHYSASQSYLFSLGNAQAVEETVRRGLDGNDGLLLFNMISYAFEFIAKVDSVMSVATGLKTSALGAWSAFSLSTPLPNPALVEAVQDRTSAFLACAADCLS